MQCTKRPISKCDILWWWRSLRWCRYVYCCVAYPDAVHVKRPKCWVRFTGFKKNNNIASSQVESSGAFTSSNYISSPVILSFPSISTFKTNDMCLTSYAWTLLFKFTACTYARRVHTKGANVERWASRKKCFIVISGPLLSPLTWIISGLLSVGTACFEREQPADESSCL